jgi:protein arginine kinase
MDLPPPQWLYESGPDSDVVVSTRCRIARNLAAFPFPWRSGELQAKQAGERLLVAAERSGSFRDATVIRGSRVDSESAVQLVRWRYASRDWISGVHDRWLLISTDARLTLLINEEDHLRLQGIAPGLQVESVRERAETAEQAISKSVEFARHPELGYLTTYLTNVGTGMRISVLVHLAGLASTTARRLDAVLDAARSLGCAVRGVYGEGTSGTGELFQVSNRFTYGASERQIADRVASAARYLVDAERTARKELFGGAQGRERLAEGARDAVHDLYRHEAHPAQLLQWVSTLRLAISEGVFPGALSETAEWVAIAGTEAAANVDKSQPPTDAAKERFLAISRSAALRNRLRPLLGS